MSGKINLILKEESSKRHSNTILELLDFMNLAIKYKE